VRPAVRDAILDGTRAASEAHRAFRMREELEATGGAVDVFGTIDNLGIPLFFTRLDKLVGACVRLSTATVGILVTTERDLHMQRFTGAHELGLFVLEHRGSLDDEKNIRWPGQAQERDPQEIAADAFAAEFLMPKWLCRDVARRHGWGRNDLTDPRVVYQLSLRMAVSYSATCWGLAAQGLVSVDGARALEAVRPKDTKRRVLGDVTLDDPWADVWVLGPGDHRVDLALGPTDLVVLVLEEQAGAGYLWDRDELETAGFAVLRDERAPVNNGTVGGPARRRMIARAPASGTYQVHLAERRRWERGAPPLSEFDLRCSTYGKQAEGEFRRDREVAAQAHH
jgi:predicted secreted protein